MPTQPCGTPLTLSNPTWAGGQFQFVLNGDSNINYIIESSTNLRTWTVVLTNTESQPTRVIVVPAIANHAFWRVAGPLFQNAIAARMQANFLGTNIMVDSFDSTDEDWSDNGQYDPSEARASGDVASGLNTSNAINVGNAKIAGVLHTAQGGTVTIGPDGSVGSIAWLSNPANAGQIEPGYLRDDLNLSFAAVSVPFNIAPSLARPRP